MEKRYQPAAIEKRLYRAWEDTGAFRPAAAGEAYCIMLPPPNVTGTLHMGHAFQVTLMDCLCRYQRMRGARVLWQPGTDHAGIATQMLVERRLAQDNVTRTQIGRDKFVAKVWEWKKHSGSGISNQLRRLGASLDWSRERFTMDEGLSQAVRHAFIELYRQDLIFRRKALVNWDPVLKTAVSDLEVVTKEEQGRLWHIRYPLAGDRGHLTVATTRPETMFGDTAVAVHPGDERYRKFIGAKIDLPLTNRRIEVIADAQVDPEFGSGCVKVTPAHDFNDHQIGLRHRLDVINIFNEDASLNDSVPADYRGLDRFAARARVVGELRQLGLLEREQPHLHSLPYGDRSHSVLEPFLTDQWFVKTRPLAAAAIAAVSDGRIRFVPHNWTKVYLDWMHNIEDWCISRQIWWGHRIPAWYDTGGKVYVGEDEQQVRVAHRLADDVVLVRDEDVLDTWFSSALWPFSTLDWPQNSGALQTFYPTSVLVTGFDIIFFWAARMIMMGLKFTGKVPFREVYIHGLVRDAQGQKMSKSKGNVLDPIDLIDGIGAQELVEKHTRSLMQPDMKQRVAETTRQNFPDGIEDFGTDALRFTFIAMASTGRDIRFDVKRIEGYRNFCNKLWNAARFTAMLCKQVPAATAPTLADRWIQSRLDRLIEEAQRHLAAYRFDLLAGAIYQFVWHDLCDWYLELVKLRQAGLKTLVEVLETALRLLHPVIPYISEEIWQTLRPLHACSEQWLQQRPWPQTDPSRRDDGALQTMARLQSFTGTIRQLRAEAGIAPGADIALLLKQWSDGDKSLFADHGATIAALARISGVQWLADDQQEPLSVTGIVEGTKVLIPLGDLIDVNAESERLNKEIAKLKTLLGKLNTTLASDGFVSKAPQPVIEKKRTQMRELSARVERYNEQLAALKAAGTKH